MRTSMYRLGVSILPFVLLVLVLDAQSPGAEPLPADDFRLEFNQLGQLQPSSQKVLESILARVSTRSDIFLFSHGWRNDPRTAEDRYQAFIKGMTRRFPQSNSGSDFRPLLVGIYWPSAWFPGNNCFATRPDTTAVSTWASTAFPSAAATSEFQRELGLVMNSLGRLVPWAQYRQIPEIIARWNGGLEPSEPEILGEPSIVYAPPSRLAEVFDQAIASNAGLARAGALQTLSPCSMLNVLSFWAMKKRAGDVGARGVHAVLQKIVSASGTGVQAPRVHLVGHSFGSKVMTAALTGPPGTPPSDQVAVHSLILIQGAFSHFSFASVQALQGFGVRSANPGRYREIIDRNLVRGQLVSFYSDQDIANVVFYPIGAALAHDYLAKPSTAADSILRDCAPPGQARTDATSASRDLRVEVPKYGAVGANGIHGVANSKCVTLARSRPAPQMTEIGGGVLNVDASNVITGHSEIAYPEVFDLIWKVVLTR
jgi:hypothetical protein